MSINWEHYHQQVLNNPGARPEAQQRSRELLGLPSQQQGYSQLFSSPTSQQGSYTVRPGDTLSGIAQQLGLPGHQSLTGYRSGDPNLIFPGEQLSYQKPGGFQDAYAETQQPATAESITGQFPSRAEGIRGEYEEAMQSRETARANLENARTNLFNKEYEKIGLGKTKERISALDESIGSLKQERDDAVLQAKRNPNVSAGVLAGEVGKVTDHFNSSINNEVNKRNAMAEEYNRNLDEIDMRVRNAIQDLAMEYDHWNTITGEMERNLHRYEDILREQLELERGDERWQQEFDLGKSEFDRDLAQRLAIARMTNERATTESPVRLERVERRNELGKATGIVDWYNPYTGEHVKTTGQ